ncbi:MAG: ribonuclease III, partial [Vicinamibacteria bacterium]
KLGYRFRDRFLLEQALTHKSFAYEAGGSSPHNESMEFLGDAVLGFVVTDFIFHKFPEFSEGRKSKIKAYLVSSVALSALALQLEIPKYLRLGKGEEKTGGRKKKALSANAFEAVLAAIYLDAGIDEVRKFLAPIYRPLLVEVGDGRAAIEDPKTALQEYLQARNLEPARYSVTAETGPEHRKTFHVELRVGERKMGSATGPTKKTAELLAAQGALSKLIREEGAEIGG